MEAPADKAAGPPAGSRIDDLIVEFRKEAERHGMHDQVIDLSERFMERAYRRGLEEGSQT